MLNVKVLKVCHYFFFCLFVLINVSNIQATIEKNEESESLLASFNEAQIDHSNDGSARGNASVLNPDTYNELLGRANAGDQNAQQEIVIRRYHRRLPRSYKRKDIQIEQWNVFEAAVTDDVYAYFVLTICSTEVIAEKCPDLILNLQQRAEDQNALAQNNLGLAYYYGRGVEQSYETAAAWFRKAADQQHAGACNQLGGLYFRGQGVEQNDEEAAFWFGKAANLGHSGAQNHLGNLYLRGQGVDRNELTAFSYYQSAAEQGNALAQTNTGLAYLNGQGVGQNDKLAIFWLKSAANQGHDLAQYWLGILLFKGQGVEQNAQDAAFWFEESAQQGYANAQYWLGVLYLRGEGVHQNSESAAYWLGLAAEQKHANAQNYLAGLYLRGEGVKKNYQTALYWYKESAAQENAAALNNLGDLHMRSCCVEQSYTAAADYFRRAADYGLPAAKFNLGKLYYEGWGVERNVGKAIDLWLDAASQGHPEAIKSLQSILKLRLFAQNAHPVSQQQMKTLIKRNIEGLLAELEVQKEENAPLIQGEENKLAIPTLSTWYQDISQLISELENVLEGAEAAGTSFMISCLVPSDVLRHSLGSENDFFQQEVIIVYDDNTDVRYDAFLSIGKPNVAAAKPFAHYYRTMGARFKEANRRLSDVMAAYTRALEDKMSQVLTLQLYTQQQQLIKPRVDECLVENFQASLQELEDLKQLVEPRVLKLQNQQKALIEIEKRFKQFVVEGACERNQAFLQTQPFLARNIRP